MKRHLESVLITTGKEAQLLDWQLLERKLQAYPDAKGRNPGMIEVGEPPDGINTYDFENVFNACASFKIGLAQRV